MKNLQDILKIVIGIVAVLSFVFALLSMVKDFSHSQSASYEAEYNARVERVLTHK